MKNLFEGFIGLLELGFGIYCYVLAFNPEQFEVTYFTLGIILFHKFSHRIGIYGENNE